ncbi:MAG: hypothetical protein MR296_02490 [Tenericutes bacterium]|nr:hypothetical protein [Mycoplasmatota bacterium]
MKFTNQGLTESFLKENIGIILSYGEAEDIKPVGVFKVNNLIGIADNKTKIGFRGLDDTVVELINIDEEKKEKIYLPLIKFIEVFPAKIAFLNKNEFNKTLDEIVTLKTLDALKRTLSRINKNIQSYNKDVYKARYKSLGDLNAMYFNSNGDAMGDNYSVMPFALDEELIKKLIKEKTLESDASENSKNNNIMYIDKELTKNKKTK